MSPTTTNETSEELTMNCITADFERESQKEPEETRADYNKLADSVRTQKSIKFGETLDQTRESDLNILPTESVIFNDWLNPETAYNMGKSLSEGKVCIAEIKRSELNELLKFKNETILNALFSADLVRLQKDGQDYCEEYGSYLREFQAEQDILKHIANSHKNLMKADYLKAQKTKNKNYAENLKLKIAITQAESRNPDFLQFKKMIKDKIRQIKADY